MTDQEETRELDPPLGPWVDSTQPPDPPTPPQPPRPTTSKHSSGRRPRQFKGAHTQPLIHVPSRPIPSMFDPSHAIKSVRSPRAARNRQVASAYGRSPRSLPDPRRARPCFPPRTRYVPKNPEIEGHAAAGRKAKKEALAAKKKLDAEEAQELQLLQQQVLEAVQAEIKHPSPPRARPWQHSSPVQPSVAARALAEQDDEVAAVQQVQKQTRMLKSLLNKVGATCAKHQSTTALLAAVMQLLESHFPGTDSYVGLVQGRTLEFSAGTSQSRMPGVQIGANGNLCWHVINSCESVALNHIESNPSALASQLCFYNRHSVREQAPRGQSQGITSPLTPRKLLSGPPRHTGSVLCVPLLLRGDAFGVLCWDTVHSRALENTQLCEFEAQHLEFLELVAGQLGEALLMSRWREAAEGIQTAKDIRKVLRAVTAAALSQIPVCSQMHLGTISQESGFGAESGSSAQELDFLSFNSAQLQRYRKWFARLDIGNKGVVTRSSIAEVSKSVNMHFSQAELNELLREVDTDNSGEIEWKEFLQMMSRLDQDAQAQRDAEQLSFPDPLAGLEDSSDEPDPLSPASELRATLKAERRLSHTSGASEPRSRRHSGLLANPNYRRFSETQKKMMGLADKMAQSSLKLEVLWASEPASEIRIPWDNTLVPSSFEEPYCAYDEDRDCYHTIYSLGHQIVIPGLHIHLMSSKHLEETQYTSALREIILVAQHRLQQLGQAEVLRSVLLQATLATQLYGSLGSGFAARLHSLEEMSMVFTTARRVRSLGATVSKGQLPVLFEPLAQEGVCVVEHVPWTDCLGLEPGRVGSGITHSALMFAPIRVGDAEHPAALLGFDLFASDKELPRLETSLVASMYNKRPPKPSGRKLKFSQPDKEYLGRTQKLAGEFIASHVQIGDLQDPMWPTMFLEAALRDCQAQMRPLQEAAHSELQQHSSRPKESASLAIVDGALKLIPRLECHHKLLNGPWTDKQQRFIRDHLWEQMCDLDPSSASLHRARAAEVGRTLRQQDVQQAVPKISPAMLLAYDFLHLLVLLMLLRRSGAPQDSDKQDKLVAKELGFSSAAEYHRLTVEGNMCLLTRPSKR